MDRTNPNTAGGGGRFLLDKSETVDDFVEMEVGVLPGLHGGLFTLENRKTNTRSCEQAVNTATVSIQKPVFLLNY